MVIIAADFVPGWVITTFGAIFIVAIWNLFNWVANIRERLARIEEYLRLNEINETEDKEDD